MLDCLEVLNENPIVIDSDKRSRQDMLPIILDLVNSSDVECVMSKPVFTRKMGYELESRGIAAFGPIFDS